MDGWIDILMILGRRRFFSCLRDWGKEKEKEKERGFNSLTPPPIFIYLLEYRYSLGLSILIFSIPFMVMGI